MKNFKRILAVVLAALLVFTFAACQNNDDKNPSSESNPASTPVDYNGEKIRIIANKGPTGMGLVQLMDSDIYDVQLTGDPTEIPALVATGAVDIATIPLNLAANIYKKTSGGVKMIGINTLGVLYVVANGININSLSDLKGQTVYATGQGATPEFIINYILEENGLKDDVKVEYLGEHSELATKMISGDVTLSILPEPFVTLVTSKNSNCKVSVSLTDEWEKINPNAELSMGCVIASTDFIKNNPEGLAKFISDNKASVEYVNVNPTQASEKIVSKEIIDEAVFAVDTTLSEKKQAAAKEEKAVKVISRCNIVFIDGQDMIDIADANFSVYFNADPASIGGEMPSAELYYVAG